MMTETADRRNMRGFHVIDRKTGILANPEQIALHEEWASRLCYCDMDGFAIMEDGSLVLMDECGHCAYCESERFDVVWDNDVRLMAKHEVKAIKEHTEYVWLELRDTYDMYHMSVYCHIPEDFFGNSAELSFDIPHGTLDLKLSEYGKEWRCWTDFPDDETRFAQEWHDDKA